MSEIWIVLTDDWELRGNGTGTVEEFQRTPARRLMDLYESLGIRSTFNLEVMQQIAFVKHADRHSEIRASRDVWLEAVGEMTQRGFDTQLHIHPQWWNAEYVHGWWKLGRRWDITTYATQEIAQICDSAFAYLAPLIAPRQIRTFRAGSWGMGPPSRAILEALSARGIEIDVSIASGLRYAGEGITLDYSTVDSPYQAYHPDIEDIRRIGCRDSATSIVEIPTQSVTHGQLVRRWLTAVLLRDLRTDLAPLHAFLRQWVRIELSNQVRRIVPRRPASAKAASKEVSDRPDFVMRDPFGVEAGTARFGMVMDISSNFHPAILQHMADIQIDRARDQTTGGMQVLVFENHTKDLRKPEDFERIRLLVRHIRHRDPDVQFRTLAEVVDRRAMLAMARRSR